MLRTIQLLELSPPRIFVESATRRNSAANHLHLRPFLSGGVSPQKQHYYSANASRIVVSISGCNTQHHNGANRLSSWRTQNFCWSQGSANRFLSSGWPALFRGTDLAFGDRRRRRQQQLHFNWIRCLTSKPPVTDDSIPHPAEEAQIPASMFISSEMNPPKESNLRNMMVDDQAHAALNRKRRQRMFAADKNTMDRFREITEMQSTRKEESRIKTAQNVHRALMGNVIICTGGQCYMILLLFVARVRVLLSNGNHDCSIPNEHSQTWCMDVVRK